MAEAKIMFSRKLASNMWCGWSLALKPASRLQKRVKLMPSEKLWGKGLKL
jgi:hypothetical protein